MAQESRERDMVDAGCHPPEGPVLCTNGCAFFGSAATSNLCSKCYRDLVLEQAKETTSANAVAAEMTSLATTQVDDVADESADQQAVGQALEKLAAAATASASEPSTKGGSLVVDADAQVERQARNRCLSCKKRVGLTGFKCRCGNLFCSTHRYSDKHNCSFDYKTAGRDAIAKANPIVKADKVEKI